MLNDDHYQMYLMILNDENLLTKKQKDFGFFYKLSNDNIQRFLLVFHIYLICYEMMHVVLIYQLKMNDDDRI